MSSASARPQTGHKFFATLSFYFSQDSKFDQPRPTSPDLKRESDRKNETSSNPGKPAPRALFLLASLAISLPILGIAGCGVEKGTAKLTDSVTLVANPSSVDFGSVNVGNSGNQKVSVANTGPDPVQITQFTVSDDTFKVDGEGTLPANLAPGSTLSFKVHFNPKKSADSTGELSVIAASSTAAATTIKLHGKGANPADPVSASLSGLTCAKPSMTATGSDTCNLTLTSAAPSGGLAVTLQSSSNAISVPSSVSIAAGASSASFVATVSSVNAQTVTLTATQGSVSKSTTIQLGATSSPAVASALSALSCGSTSITGALADTCTVSLSGAAPAGGFSVALASSSSAVKVPASITVPAAAASATFTANVSAVSTAQSVTLTATQGSVSKSTTIQLGATSSPASAPALSALSCGSTSIAGALADTCTVSLSGAAPAGGFSVALASSSSAVKVPASITVPAAAASATFTANVSAVGTAQSVTLTATKGSVSEKLSLQLKPGTAALAVNATSIAFGSTSLNTPTSQSLKLTSTGSASVTVKSVAIAGTGFSISRQTFPVTLNPGQSLSLDLQFDPTAAGNATGQLTISSNASSNATAVISLTGTGIAHKVTLNWDAPSGNEAIAGYNIYRATASATSYQRLNSRPNAGTAFTDSSVQSGKSYNYMVKTVNSNGVESKPSNQTTVTIP